MPLQSSGPISLNDINIALGIASATTISMNSTVVRGLLEVPTANSAISMSNAYGKANEIVFNISSQNNLNLRNYAVANGASAYKRLIFNINGNIGSTSTALPAITTGTDWLAGTLITLNIANGIYVVGAGGAGGNNGTGGAGGNAISLNHNITIVNNGIIGGGGGGAGSQSLNALGFVTVGGGGGAGLVAGAAGVGSRNNVFVYGAAGSLTSGGVGCYRGGSTSGQTVCTSDRGGGSLGQGGTSIPDGPGGGAAGKAIALNTYTATRPVVGTVFGDVS